MLNFTNTPPEDPRGQSLHLMRCPPNRPFCGIITCDDVVGTPTHFYHGRTIPCDDADCPACSEGFPWRWHSYVSVFLPANHRTVLFESTAKAARTLVTYRKAYKTLRGCKLTAKRVNTSPNSQVFLQTQPADLERISLPDPPDIVNALSIIWNIKKTAIRIAGIQRDQPRLHVENNLERIKSRLSSLTSTHPSPPSDGNGKDA